MINISKLYCDQLTPGDWLRYGVEGGQRDGQVVPKTAEQRKPIVVWNITPRCNLNCVHCYNDSGANVESRQATTPEAKAVLDDGVRLMKSSGGK